MVMYKLFCIILSFIITCNGKYIWNHVKAKAFLNLQEIQQTVYYESFELINILITDTLH